MLCVCVFSSVYSVYSVCHPFICKQRKYDSFVYTLVSLTYLSFVRSQFFWLHVCVFYILRLSLVYTASSHHSLNIHMFFISHSDKTIKMLTNKKMWKSKKCVWTHTHIHNKCLYMMWPAALFHSNHGACSFHFFTQNTWLLQQLIKQTDRSIFNSDWVIQNGNKHFYSSLHNNAFLTVNAAAAAATVPGTIPLLLWLRGMFISIFKIDSECTNKIKCAEHIRNRERTKISLAYDALSIW